MSPCSLSQVFPAVGIAFSLLEMAVARAPWAAQCLQEWDAQGMRTGLSLGLQLAWHQQCQGGDGKPLSEASLLVFPGKEGVHVHRGVKML